MTEQIHVEFNHGLGDSTNFAIICELHKRRGQRVVVSSSESNKRWLWEATGLSPAIGRAINHPWEHPHSFWGDVAVSECQAHKVSANINSILTPIGGTCEDLWRELCGVELNVMPAVRPEIHSEAERFLEGLSGPIVVLHACGTNSQEGKRIDAETQLKIQRQLVDAGCSVVVLDFDARAVQVGHDRIRGIKPTWGHLSLEQLAALLSRCAVMIGVDSGPLHFARLTPISVLGVFFNRSSLLPHRVAIPSPRLTSLVPGSLRHIWQDRIRQNIGWQFADYSGDAPTAGEISQAAMAIIDGHAPGLTSADDFEAFAGSYTYERVGHGPPRELSLRSDGMIGTGSAEREDRWRIRKTADSLLLSIIDAHGDLTCNLTIDATGVWRGQWVRFEKMPIILTPRSQSRIVITNEAYSLVSGRYTYRRFHPHERPDEPDQRPMVLNADGTIGEGAAGCERKWTVETVNGRNQITIVGDDRATCTLFADSRGNFHGRWNHNERMAVTLFAAVPKEPPAVDAATLRSMLLGKTWNYHRIGWNDSRPIEFRADERIGVGAAERETAWRVIQKSNGSGELWIFGRDGNPQIKAMLESDGVIRGRWEHGEKMAVEFIPDMDAPIPVDESRQFIVGIPTLLRYDLLAKCIDAVLAGSVVPQKIIVIDNGGTWAGHPSPCVEIIRPGKNLGVAASWNAILDRTMPVQTVMLNDDIEVGRNTIERMLELDAPFVSGDERARFSMFLLRPQCWNEIGRFDEHFEVAYLEDDDYAYRMKLAGIRWLTAVSDGFHDHGPSATRSAMSDADRLALDCQADRNRAYFAKKWGGAPRNETFTSPFGESAGVSVTPIRQVFTRPDTDKESNHSYGEVYESLLADRRSHPGAILEIGIAVGGSLRAWSEIFPMSTIHGVDVDPATMITGDPRIQTHCANVMDKEALSAIGEKAGPFHLIVDDGSHRLPDMMHAYFALKQFLTPDGLYVIEDVPDDMAAETLSALPGSKCIDRRAIKGRWDDRLIVIQAS